MPKTLKTVAVEEQRKRLLQFAEKHLGKPYVYGARSREAPKRFDCSSFTQYLYQRVGIDVPRTALEQAKCGRMVQNPKRRRLEVGDLLFFTGSWGRYDPDFPAGIGHVSLYAGSGMIIHAKYEETKSGKPAGTVRKERAEQWLSRKDLVTVQRIIT